MSVERQANILGQQRLDVPHLRAIESSIAADFDLLAGRILAGGQPLVVRGMALITANAVGNPATSLQLQTANSIIMHSLASEHGTIFAVAADQPVEVLNSTNPNVTGSFTAGQVNYVGLDLRRTADDSTADLVQFMDADSKLETPKTVPLARTLNYTIVISTSDFDTNPNLLPIAKITTSSTNVVTAIVDARPMNFRLGSGGSVPNSTHAYPWATGRAEISSGSVFTGADKDIVSTKDWMDAVMTRLWETGGGEHWYSPTADRNVNLVWIGSAFSNGENFEWSGTNLHWQGIRLIFDNSTGTYNNVSDQTSDSVGLTDLADGDCIYVDLSRGSNATVAAAKSALSTLGPGSVPGSRYVIAWRVGSSVYTRGWRYPIGTLFTPATTSSQGLVKITRDYAGVDTSGASSLDDPKALSDRGGTITTPLVGNVGLTIKRFDAGADIQRWQTSAGTTLTSVNNSGDLVFATSARKISWTGISILESSTGAVGFVVGSTTIATISGNGTNFSNIELFSDNSPTIAGHLQVDETIPGMAIGTDTAASLFFDVATTHVWKMDVTSGGDLIALGGNHRIQGITDAASLETGTNVVNVQSAYKLAAAYRNLIINGGMDFWQRGTSVSVPNGSAAYIADRWGHSALGGSTSSTISQQTDVPTANFKFSLRAQRTVSTSSTATIYTIQEVDRKMLQWYGANTNIPLTLSFWVKKGADLSGTLKVEVHTSNGDQTIGWLNVATGYSPTDSIPVTQTLSPTTGWTQVTVAVPNLGNTGGVTSQAAVMFKWAPSGTAATNDWFQVTGIMLTPQDRIAPTIFVPAGGDSATEYMLCQRYFEKSYERDTNPGTSTTAASLYGITNGVGTGTTLAWVMSSHPRFTVQKWRNGATAKVYAQDGTANSWFLGGSNRASVADSTSAAGGDGAANTNGFYVVNSSGGTVTPSAGTSEGHWTADAEFY